MSKFCPDLTSHEEVQAIKDLIEEQPKIENTIPFKHFKLYADSTLKNMTKDELISYIHILYHNWSVTDEQLCNVMNCAMKQEKALDKACEELGKMCKQTKCKDCHFVKEQVNEDNDCPVQGNITYCDWKEWCMKDVE